MTRIWHCLMTYVSHIWIRRRKRLKNYESTYLAFVDCLLKDFYQRTIEVLTCFGRNRNLPRSTWFYTTKIWNNVLARDKKQKTRVERILLMWSNYFSYKETLSNLAQLMTKMTKRRIDFFWLDYINLNPF